MNRCLISLSISMILACCAGAGEPKVSPLSVVWEITEEVRSPESAYFHEDSGFLYVSQIGDGGPTGKDGDGTISRLSPDGKMLDARWITGLDAPKGLRSCAGRLWVSDIDRLVAIDIARGKIVERIDVPGAVFLNDVACDAQGAIYVSDMLASKIYGYRDGRLEVFAEGEELEYPNGLLVEGNRLLVAAWGRPKEDFSTETPGRLFALDLKTAEKSLITPEPLGNLDGLEAVAEGRYLVSDWYAGKILYVTGDGRWRTVLELPQGAADIGHIRAERLLVVPQMLENKITAFRLPRPARPRDQGGN